MLLFLPLSFTKLNFLYLFLFDFIVLPSLKCGVELHLSSLVPGVNMTGELHSAANGGFSEINIDFNVDQRLQVKTNEVKLHNRQEIRSITDDRPFVMVKDDALRYHFIYFILRCNIYLNENETHTNIPDKLIINQKELYIPKHITEGFSIHPPSPV